MPDLSWDGNTRVVSKRHLHSKIFGTVPAKTRGTINHVLQTGNFKTYYIKFDNGVFWTAGEIGKDFTILNG